MSLTFFLKDVSARQGSEDINPSKHPVSHSRCADQPIKQIWATECSRTKANKFKEEATMRIRLRESTDSICPYCALTVKAPGNKVKVLNTFTGDAVVECECGEQYFIVEVPDET